VRSAQIWAPSASEANDPARARNCGKMLKARHFQASRDKDICSGLLRVSSAPAIVSPVSSAGSPSPKTPRRVRGMVRKVSKVSCSYPEVNLHSQSRPTSPASPSSSAATRKRLAASASTARSMSEPPSRPKSPAQKQVSFADELPEELQKITTSCSPEGFQSQALKRSLRMMDSLHDLRRVQRDEDAHVAAGVPIPREDENEQGALLHSTLADLFDSETVLRSLEEQLRSAQGDAQDCGGARHATAVLSARTLTVVRRKAALLHAVEIRTAEFESAHSRRDEIVAQLLAGASEAPPELMGILKFINHYTHKGGNPVDADKSDFESFAAAFKLPYKHRALHNLRDLSDRISQWWAEESLRVAQEGATHVQIRRMFAVTIGTGADEDHPYLLRATTILNDRLADKMLKDAQDRQRSDTEAAARSEVALVGPASRAADAINQSINEIIAEGVPEHDRRIIEAKKIMKQLREADGQRKRLAGRQKRLQNRGR